MKFNGYLIILVLALMGACGKDVLKRDSTSANTGSNTNQVVNYTPGAPDYMPIILSLYYYDNGTSVEWEYPRGQVANYRIEFCSNNSFANCSKTIMVSCSAPGSCAKTYGSTGIIAVGDGRSPGREAILYSYQPVGQTYAIRVRAESANGNSAWMSATQCEFSLPAQCYAP